jgi:hypothetical protein
MSKLKHQPGEQDHIIFPCFLYLMFIYEYIVTSIDGSHTKRTLTFPIEKEQTESDAAPSPINDTKQQQK